MKQLVIPFLVLPLAACSVGKELESFEVPSFKLPSVSALFEGPSPETRPLKGSITQIAKPSTRRIPSMTVTSLVDGTSTSYSVRQYGNGVRVTEGNGCVWTRASDWFSPSDSWASCGTSKNWHTGQARVRELDSLYPLKVGAVGRYERRAVSHTGRSYTRETRCEVTDAVEVLRPDRATPAFVVKCDDSRRVRTTWYAPNEGPIAYREVHRRNGVEEAWVRSN